MEIKVKYGKGKITICSNIALLLKFVKLYLKYGERNVRITHFSLIRFDFILFYLTLSYSIGLYLIRLDFILFDWTLSYSIGLYLIGLDFILLDLTLSYSIGLHLINLTSSCSI
ncbi:hypothetical protein MKS88_001160 [Plasmodium brasilianum]|uniref:Uncharacterized protein n=1 Tax=Plasmodium brasilianum TaxID=5824 RepID=A0ACB9YDH3_PLABR|nr:hypothetical protein MKS88_001160 [Plasmodium brasilianum]